MCVPIGGRESGTLILIKIVLLVLRSQHFNSAKVFLNFDFDKFLTAIENGSIMFDIRIGSYKSGKHIGKPHDHGSSFRIKREKINQLYEQVYEIE